MNTLFEQAAVHLIAYRRDMPTLLFTEDVACPTDLEIAHGNLKTGTQPGKFNQGLEPLERIGIYMPLLRQEEIAIGLVLIAADPAAKLEEIEERLTQLRSPFRSAEAFWIEEIIDIIETEASCELYGLLKRPDEKFVTEKAYDNPKFVEDLVRDIARKFNEDERIEAYSVEAENFESIHNHSAYAQITRGLDS